MYERAHDTRGRDEKWKAATRFDPADASVLAHALLRMGVKAKFMPRPTDFTEIRRIFVYIYTFLKNSNLAVATIAIDLRG